jgi:hypothetical protein
MLLTKSSLCSKNDRQWSINNFRPPNLDNHGTIQLHWSIIKLSATFWGKNAYNKIVTMSHNECQQSFNDFWGCILYNPTAINTDNPQWIYWQPLMAKMLVTISHQPPRIEHPKSVNSVCEGSERYTAINCIVLFLNRVLHSQSLQSVLVYNFTNMHEMSHRSDFLLLAVNSLFKNPESALLYRYFWQSLKSDDSAC